MTVVNPKSISGINSITMASGSDNLLTIHSNNTTERVRVDSSGNLTATSFSGDGSSLTGVASTENIRTNTNATFLQNVNVSGTSTIGGDVNIADKIVHVGDTNTAIRFPDADTISFETAATERLRISSSGGVGIGTISPSVQLHLHNATQTIMRFTDAGAGTDTKHWNNVANGNEFYWQAIADNGSGGGNLFKFLRSGNDIQSFEGTNSGSTWLTISNQYKQVRLSDNSELKLGSDLDMKIFHNNTDGVIENGTGDFYIQNDNATTSEKIYIRAKAEENGVLVEANGAVHLYHNPGTSADSSFFTRYDGFTTRNNNVESGKDCNVDFFSETGGNVGLHLYPDKASNNNHKFRILATDSEAFVIQGYYTGAYTDFIQCTKATNNTANLRVRVGKGGLRFDDACEDYRDVDGDGHLFRRDGQAQIGVDDFFYFHDIDASDTNNRIRQKFDTNSGSVFAEGNFNANQSLDYAEFFEWSDGNPSNEDRIGHTVSIDGLTGKIKIAEEGETVIGAISGTAGVIGGGHETNWHGRFKHDEWGREVFEELKDESGNLLYSDAETRSNYVKTNRIETSEYNSSLDNSYVPRALRKEWAVVGLLGQIRVRKTAVIPSNWVKLKEIDSVKDFYLVR